MELNADLYLICVLKMQIFISVFNPPQGGCATHKEHFIFNSPDEPK